MTGLGAVEGATVSGPTMTRPVGARVLIDCDGGPILCEVIEVDALRGFERVRMILPGQPRDGLTFWRPWDAPVVAEQAALL